jgi:hypothetical protein
VGLWEVGEEGELGEEGGGGYWGCECRVDEWENGKSELGVKLGEGVG